VRCLRQSVLQPRDAGTASESEDCLSADIKARELTRSVGKEPTFAKTAKNTTRQSKIGAGEASHTHAAEGASGELVRRIFYTSLEAPREMGQRETERVVLKPMRW